MKKPVFADFHVKFLPLLVPKELRNSVASWLSISKGVFKANKGFERSHIRIYMMPALYIGNGWRCSQSDPPVEYRKRTPHRD